MNRYSSFVASVLLLSGCNSAGNPDNVAAAGNAATELPPSNALPPPEADLAAPSGAAVPADAWIGKWVGVEGLALDIRQGQAPGRYLIDVTLLDGTNSYEGEADGDVIRFTRDGEEETIRAATGDETGLKWLAGKQDCLMIDPGEGFCRD